ncbi:TPA: hypothetical protein N8034_004632 [Escherichia coli]|nr:hypothetical protein [Escherichia coli]
MHNFKLKPTGMHGEAPKNTGPWTQQEENLLIALYPAHTSKEIAAKINRTVSSVENHIFKLRKARKVHLKHARPGELKSISSSNTDTPKPCRKWRTSWD